MEQLTTPLMRLSMLINLKDTKLMHKITTSIKVDLINSLTNRMVMAKIRAVVLIVTTLVIKNHQEKEAVTLDLEVVEDQTEVTNKKRDA